MDSPTPTFLLQEDRAPAAASTSRVALLFRSFPFLLALKLALFFIIKKFLNRDASVNFSQTGEDAIIRSLLDEHSPGVYVDVGCNEPIKGSNTLSLYLHGWQGVNIDANQRLIERFQATRIRDIAVCAAISDVETEMVFHEFDMHQVSTLSAEVLPEWRSKWKESGERKVRTRTLNAVLEEKLPKGTEIGLLSIDVEGHDLNVLRSLDLNLWRPKLIVIEMHHFDLQRAAEHPVVRYLAGQGFRQIGYDSLNGYFVDVRSARSGLHLP